MTQQLAADGLPPLAPPDATDDERAGAIVARMVARHGAPSIEDYRQVYQQSGVPWPGDEAIRRRHRSTDRGRCYAPKDGASCTCRWSDRPRPGAQSGGGVVVDSDALDLN